MGERVKKSILHLHRGDSHRAKGDQEAGRRGEFFMFKDFKPIKLFGGTVKKILYLHQGDSHWAKGDQEAGQRARPVPLRRPDLGRDSYKTGRGG